MQTHAYDEFDPKSVVFYLKTDKEGKTRIMMNSKFGILTPECVTHWPKCTGDGDFGSKFGPEDYKKTKFMLDLNDTPFTSEPNSKFAILKQKLDELDDVLLQFIFENQMKTIGRKNLTLAECKPLQNRSVRAKYNTDSEEFLGYKINLSYPKFNFDEVEQSVRIVDYKGDLLQNAVVSSGDVVSTVMYPSMVYTMDGRFGIKWQFNAVSIICQQSNLPSNNDDLQVFKKRKLDIYSEYVDVERPSQFAEDNSEKYSYP